jgi:hypothetical protein
LEEKEREKDVEGIRLEAQAQSGVQARRKTMSSIKTVVFWAFIMAVLFGLHPRKNGTHSRELIALAILVAVILVLNLLPLLLQWTVGTVGLVEIRSPEFEQRIRKRYETEISQLTDLGFYHLFFVGDDTSVFRLFLIFPALIVFTMWRKGVPMIVQNGRLHTGNPVFLARDKTAFAHPNTLGITFHTAFQDGTLLVTKNFGNDARYIPSIVGNSRPGASIGSLWAAHQERLQALMAAGRRVDSQSSFQAYEEIIHKEQTRG